MTRTELVTKMSKTAGLSRKDTDSALNAFISVVSDELESGGNVIITGFGTFEVVEKAEKTGRNPQNGEEIIIPAHKIPHFKAGKNLKDTVNK